MQGTLFAESMPGQPSGFAHRLTHAGGACRNGPNFESMQCASTGGSSCILIVEWVLLAWGCYQDVRQCWPKVCREWPVWLLVSLLHDSILDQYKVAFVTWNLATNVQKVAHGIHLRRCTTREPMQLHETGHCSFVVNQKTQASKLLQGQPCTARRSAQCAFCHPCGQASSFLATLFQGPGKPQCHQELYVPASFHATLVAL